MRNRLKHRRIPGLEFLEPRVLLSGALPSFYSPNSGFPLTAAQPAGSFQPTYVLFAANGALTPLQTSGPQGYSPAQIRNAYGLNQVAFAGQAADGTGQTIAIIDAYNDPTIRADLHAFDVAFGLADPTLKVVAQDGSSNLPTVDPVGPGGANFEGEEALDVEWAHALAPGATIMLVEAKDASPSNIFAAVDFARRQPGVSVVSMSFGGNEAFSQTQYDALFTTPAGHIPVTFIASTGDAGVPAGYPAYSPNVLATGGTSLAFDSLGNYQSEIGWSNSGGGRSMVESKPSYQNALVSGTARATPDVAFDADPRTGVAVYDSYNNGSATPWEVLGGTSVAAPAWAGIIAVADQGRVLAGKVTLDSRTATLPLIYAAPAADFHDITSGNNGQPAQAGYDLVTGRGSPRANLLIPYLVTGVTLPPSSSGPVIASISASALTLVQGSALTLTANGVSDPGASGLAVTFYQESNGVAGLQTNPTTGDFAFTPVTDGSNAITLDTSTGTGSFTFYAQLTDSAGKASSAGIAAPSVVVNVVAPSSSGPVIAAISASPNPVISGQPLTLSASGISDAQASVARVYFYEESNGVAGLQTGPKGDFAFPSVTAVTGFSLQLDTTGVTGSLTFYARAIDLLGNASPIGLAAPAVTVNLLINAPPDAPTGLTATAVSSTGIDLAFSQTNTGQTGFTIERSLNPNFTTFVRVFSINRPTALTYSDTGLSPGTRYYYRVQAFNAAGNSGFSNTANAATGYAPFGVIDLAGPAVVAGWTIDPDSPTAPVTVQLQVDGALYGTTTANLARPDLTGIYGSSNHGFSFDLSALTPGFHRIDIIALDTTTSAPTKLGKTRTITTNQPPTGWIDGFNATALIGWAFDPNAGAAAIQIRYSIDNRAPLLATANVTRSDLASHLGSADHGFNIALPQLSAGLHTVRVYAVDSTTNALVLLGARSENIANPSANPLPVGNLDLARTTRVAGWAWDPSTPGKSLTVRIDVDGVAGVPFTANVSRPDVSRYVHFGGAFGFDRPLSLSPGEHRIDIYAIDTPSGTPVLLASQIVSPPPPDGLPAYAGAIDVASRSQISGWAWSAALAGSSATVEIAIDNVPIILAVNNLPRPDLTAIYGPGSFGFSVTTPTLSSGTHKLTLYLLDPLTLTPTLIAVQTLIIP